ncbi:MAG: 3-deoxy-manno-octulosonate cytidylyltransferase [Gemmatimonadota bacterium]
MSVLCVLPARVSSERIPQKPLQILAGHPLIEWSWRAARRVPSFDHVWVATDSEEVAATVESFGGKAVLTDPERPSGTDRVAEAARRIGVREGDIVVNFQADEPFADPSTVARAVEVVRQGAPACTVAAPILSTREWESPSVVKVVVAGDGRALYFSRAGVPRPRDGGGPGSGEPSRFLRHVGIYAFGSATLDRWIGLGPSRLERIEGLEQLRVLEAGVEMRVVVGPATEPGVDEPPDLERARKYLHLEKGKNGSERDV